VKSAVKRIVLEVLGWILVVVGIAALVLPGPGLLALFAGVALLATQYEWAERRVEPVKRAALRTAADSVKSWPRIALSAFGVLWLADRRQVVAGRGSGDRCHADRLGDPGGRDGRLQLRPLPRDQGRGALGERRLHETARLMRRPVATNTPVNVTGGEW
jgi:uncharacterized protein (TIGR02611 family)